MFKEDEDKVREIVAQEVKESMRVLREEMKAMAVKPEVEESIFESDKGGTE